MVRERVRGRREFLSVVKATMVARTATMSAAVGFGDGADTGTREL
jgi:hypothetical protein